MTNSKIEIDHVISIGSCCHTATFLKENGFKLCSFPFDWVFSGAHVVYEILADNFNNFLNRELYTPFTESRNGHKIYGYRFFNHKYPIGDRDYEYYKRCVDRFRYVLNKIDEPKLFIMSNMCHEKYQNFDYDNDKKYIGKIKEILDTMTSNHYILYIDPITPTGNISTRKSMIFNNKNYEVEIEDNIFYIKLYVDSISDGVRFLDKADNENYKNCILDNFNLHIKNVIL